MRYEVYANREGSYEMLMLGGASLIRKSNSVIEHCQDDANRRLLLEIRDKISKALFMISDNADAWSADEMHNFMRRIIACHDALDNLTF